MNDRTVYRPMMREIPASERPRERLRDYGETALNAVELLAILLRSGTARESALVVAERLLHDHHGLGGLSRLSFEQLRRERGLGEAKAAELKAALELGRRLRSEEPETRPSIRTPSEVQNLLGPTMGFLDHEEVRVLLLNTKNQVLTEKLVYRGSVNSAGIRVAEVFKDAIQYNAPAIILVHNHPSGDPAPSPEDIAVTRRIVSAGTALDVDVLDHVIVTQRAFVSMKGQGLGFD